MKPLSKTLNAGSPIGLKKSLIDLESNDNNAEKLSNKTIRCPSSFCSAQSEVDIALEDICDHLKNLPEIEAKKGISLAAKFSSLSCEQSLEEKYAQPGDDCSAIKTENGYQLLAMEGMLPSFVKDDPKAAGWSAVMANVSDIAAMGGRATAVINAFWHNNENDSQIILSSIKRACNTWGLTFAGGHSSINKNHSENLAVGILGFAKKLLSCHHVRPQQRLFMLTDLRGSWHGDLPYWGCVSGKSKKEIQEQWNIPAKLAENELAVAAKDISNGGILGTLIMMLELTGCGAEIDMNAIQKPDSDLLRWMKAFQSYGFLIAVETDKTSEFIKYFINSPLTCCPIGSTNNSGKIVLHDKGSKMLFWDLKKESLTGMGKR